jgi:hypothetical protein
LNLFNPIKYYFLSRLEKGKKKKHFLIYYSLLNWKLTENIRVNPILYESLNYISKSVNLFVKSLFLVILIGSVRFPNIKYENS